MRFRRLGGRRATPLPSGPDAEPHVRTAARCAFLAPELFAFSFFRIAAVSRFGAIFPHRLVTPATQCWTQCRDCLPGGFREGNDFRREKLSESTKQTPSRNEKRTRGSARSEPRTPHTRAGGRNSIRDVARSTRTCTVAQPPRAVRASPSSRASLTRSHLNCRAVDFRDRDGCRFREDSLAR